MAADGAMTDAAAKGDMTGAAAEGGMAGVAAEGGTASVLTFDWTFQRLCHFYCFGDHVLSIGEFFMLFH